MVDTSVYGKDERCEFWIYGKLNRADTTADQGIKVGMEIAVLKLMDEAPDVGEGIEPVLPHLGEPGGSVDGPLEVGRMEIGIAGTTRHLGEGGEMIAMQRYDRGSANPMRIRTK